MWQCRVGERCQRHVGLGVPRPEYQAGHPATWHSRGSDAQHDLPRFERSSDGSATPIEQSRTRVATGLKLLLQRVCDRAVKRVLFRLRLVLLVLCHELVPVPDKFRHRIIELAALGYFLGDQRLSFGKGFV